MDKIIKNKKLIFLTLGGIVVGSVALLFILGYVSIFVGSAGALALVWICRLLTALMLVAIGALVGMLFLDKSFKNEFKISLLAYIVTIGTIFVLFILSLIIGLLNIYAGQFFATLNNAIQIPFFLVNGFALVCVIKCFLQNNDNKKNLLNDMMSKDSSDKDDNDSISSDNSGNM